MTSEPEPSTDDVPLGPEEHAPLGSSARQILAALDPRSQFAVGTGIAVAVIGLLGSIVGAWSLSFSGAILVAAGLIAAGAAYVASGREAAPPTVVPLRDLILGGGTIAAALGILFVAEIVTDLSDLTTYGGVLGLLLTIGLGVAGVALYLAATEWWSGPVEPWTTGLAAGGRPTRLVFVGAALVLLGWLGNITFGFWYLQAGSEVITLSLLAALVMRAAADPHEPLRLPLPAAFLGLAAAVIGAIIAIEHTSALLGQSAPIEDWLAQLIYIVGVVLVVAGAGLGTTEGARRLTEGPTGATPQL
ncbi:MAG: hypothetical protein ABJC39_01605 [Chloroflexota bacterium]